MMKAGIVIMRKTDHLSRAELRKSLFTLSESAEKRLEKARQKRRGLISLQN